MQAQSLQGLPPAIVITAENDPLRDEGEAYAKRLAQEGVSVDFKRFDGIMYEFFGLAGAVSRAKEALTEAVDGLKRVFNVRSASAAS